MTASLAVGCEVLVCAEVPGVFLEKGWKVESLGTVSVEPATLLAVFVGLTELDFVMEVVVDS